MFLWWLFSCIWYYFCSLVWDFVGVITTAFISWITPQLFFTLLFHPQVSDMDSFSSGNIHCCKGVVQSRNNNRLTNNVDPDEPACLDLHCLQRSVGMKELKCKEKNKYGDIKERTFKYIENFTSKTWKNSDKKLIFFHMAAQNIDCGYSLELPRRGGSNEYPQSMFWAEIRKTTYTPVNPSFTT